jgi:hypothetical protein
MLLRRWTLAWRPLFLVGSLMRLGLPLGRGLGRGWKRLRLLMVFESTIGSCLVALVTLVAIKTSVIRLSDPVHKHRGRRLVEIRYASVVNPVHELCLREMQLVLRWRSATLAWSFRSVFTLHSNLKVINRELSFNY